jgi:hypothetical protein
MKRPILMILMLTLSIVPGLIAPPAGAGGSTLLADSASRETATVDQSAPPSIMIPDPLFTFDNVVDGTEVVHDFRVNNRGKGDLAIEKVQTG